MNHKEVFPERPALVPRGRTLKRCACAQWFTVPNCHAALHRSCSASCGKAALSKGKMARRRPCQACGKLFTPRKPQVDHGYGKYCSQVCNGTARIGTPHPKPRPRMSDAERKRRAKLSHDKHIEARRATHRRYLTANRDKVNRRLREYRAANPHKLREWARERKGRRQGRLPRGTIPAKFQKQRGQCAICRAVLSKSYHVDHIVPLARGGPHEPGNLQLLCGSCNVRKSARDPIEHMQSLGFLL